MEFFFRQRIDAQLDEVARPVAAHSEVRPPKAA